MVYGSGSSDFFFPSLLPQSFLCTHTLALFSLSLQYCAFLHETIPVCCFKICGKYVDVAFHSAFQPGIDFPLLFYMLFLGMCLYSVWLQWQCAVISEWLKILTMISCWFIFLLGCYGVTANDVKEQWSCDRCREGSFTAVSQFSCCPIAPQDSTTNWSSKSHLTQLRVGGEVGGQKLWLEILSFRLNLWSGVGVPPVLTILFEQIQAMCGKSIWQLYILWGYLIEPWNIQ